MIKKIIKKIWKEHKIWLLLLLFTWGLYFISLWPRVISIKPDGIYFGHEHIWSDWALHVGIASIFAYKSPSHWFAYHPMYAGGKFTYPFLSDFISGLMMRNGISLTLSFIIPSIVFSLFLILGIYFLFYLVLKSKAKSFIALSLFFLSSGLGFINFLKDFWENPNLKNLLYPLKDYSPVPDIQWFAGNALVGMFFPQRAFLLGMTIAVWLLALFLYAISKDNHKYQKAILVFSGILAGILPITHMHSFIAVFVITGLICFAHLKKWKLLLYYVLPAGVISSLLFFIFIFGGIENKNFFSWSPGWTIKGGFIAWSKTWLYLWGLMLPLAFLGYIIGFKKFNVSVRIFFVGFFLLFILGNLILIQPIAWDNSKIFLWAYLGFSALSATAISWFWNKKIIGKIITIFLIFSLTATGFLELIRLQRTDRHNYRETAADDIRLGLMIRQKTDPLALFLTSPDHNHLIMMWAARPILMGYSAWVWNFGFLYQQRWQDINNMFQGGPLAEKLLKKYKVSYVVIGPSERKNFKVNEEYFYQNFKIAFQNKNYKIYDVRKLWLREVRKN